MENSFSTRILSFFERTSHDSWGQSPYTVTINPSQYTIFYLTSSNGRNYTGLIQFGYPEPNNFNPFREVFVYDAAEADPYLRVHYMNTTYLYKYSVDYDSRTGTPYTWYQVLKMESKYPPALTFQWKAPSSVMHSQIDEEVMKDLKSFSLVDTHHSHTTNSKSTFPSQMLLTCDIPQLDRNYYVTQDKDGKRVKFGPANYYIESSGKVWDTINFTYSVPSIYCRNRQDGRICIMFLAFQGDGYIYEYMKFYFPNGQLQALLRAKSTLLLKLFLDNGDVWEGPDPTGVPNEDIESNANGLMGSPKVRVPSRGLIVVDQSLVLQKSEVCDWPLEVIHQLLITPKKKGGIGLHPQQLKSNMKIYGNMLDMIMMDLKEHDESFAIQEMSKSLNHEYFVAKLIVQWVKQHLCQDNE